MDSPVQGTVRRRPGVGTGLVFPESSGMIMAGRPRLADVTRRVACQA